MQPFSIVVLKLLEDLENRTDQKVSMNIFKEAEEKLRNLNKQLRETVWAWRLATTLVESGTKDGAFLDLKEEVEKLLQSVEDEVLDAKDESIKEALQSMMEEIDSIDDRMSDLNEVSTKRALDWKEKIEQRSNSLLDFSGLLDKKSLGQLSAMKEKLRIFPLTTDGLATLSGTTRKSMQEEIGKLNTLATNLGKIEEKLKPPAIEKKFGIKGETIKILKKLVRGEILPLSNLSPKEITELKKVPKLSNKITLQYVSERTSESHNENEREWRKRAFERKRADRKKRIQNARDAGLL